MRRSGTALALALLMGASTAAAQPFRVGLTGVRVGAEADACRPYTLTHGLPEMHSEAAVRGASDATWRLGLGAGNTLDVRFRAPVPAAQIAFAFYGYVSGPGVCDTLFDVLAGEELLGQAQLPAALCRDGANHNFWGVVVIDVPAADSAPTEARRLESVRLLDRSPIFELHGPHPQLYWFELLPDTTSPRPRVASTGINWHFVMPGFDASSLETGFYIANRGEAPRPLPLPPGENAQSSVWIDERPDGTAALLSFAEMQGPDPSLVDKIFVLDLVTAGAQPRVLAQLPAPLSELFYDQCLDRFYAIMVDGNVVSFSWDGVVTATEFPEL